VLALVLVVSFAGCSEPPDVAVSVSKPEDRLLPPGASRDAGVEKQFTTFDGATLGYISYKASGARTALVYLHGIESHAGWFAPAAARLRDLGYDVYCLDRRGSGINRENRGFPSGHVDSYRTLLADVGEFVKPLKKRYDAVFLVGLSWGGKLALGYMLDRPEDVRGLILITPGLKALVDVSILDKLKIVAFTAIRPTAPIATPIEPEMFTTTPQYLDYIRRDPLRLHYASARFFFETPHLDRHNERKIADNRTPMLVFLAGNDRIIDNDGVRAMLEQRGSGRLDVIDYEDQTHSIQFDAVERMVGDMHRWIGAQ
jgi:alpha-beta hydrolase superfamily lysophospholipase